MMSTTANINDWIVDGSEGSTISVSGNNVTAMAARQGTPFNIRFHKAFVMETRGEDQFSIGIRELSGSVFIGLVSQEEFQQGWGTRGMLYGGNLSNGNSLLQGDFGKRIGAGDQVAVRILKKQNKTTEVEFVMNGKSLGTAFRLGPEYCRRIFFPCIHVAGRVSFVYKDGIATTVDWVMAPSVTEEEEYEGEWKIDSLEVECASIELPQNRPIIIALRGKPSPTLISVRVANTLRGAMRVTGQGEDTLGGPGSQNITVRHVATTMMMAPPELQKIEDVLTKVLPSLTKMTLVLGNHLYLAGSGVSSSEIMASRYNRTFEPLTKY